MIKVEIDLTHSHLWDHSAVDAIDRVVFKYRRLNIPVTLIGMNEASKTILDKLAVHDKSGAVEGSGH